MMSIGVKQGKPIQVITVSKLIPKEVPMTNDKWKKQWGSEGSSDSLLHHPPTQKKNSFTNKLE